MTGRLFLAVATLGCGRVAFDPVSDAVQDDAASRDPTVCDELTGVLFCEDFEGAPQLTTVDSTPPSFVVTDDGTRAYRGARALHSRTTRSSEPSWILGGVLPNLTSGELYVRWYMYVPAQPAVLNLATIHLVESVSPFPGVVLGIAGNDLEVSATALGDFERAADAIPRDRWACYQARIVISDTAGSVAASIDGVVRASIVGTNTQPVTGYRNIHAGSFATSLSSGTTDVWIDELVASTGPIACD